jgi:glycosyltransferase involved in cell wall biosynthesis
MTDKIEFLGLVKSEIKNQLICKAWVMVAPSYSDVIGMVNLEAASFKVPMITTYNVGLKKEWAENGGKLINPNVKELKNALIEVLNWNINERNKNGELLFNFVKKNYAWKSRLPDWIKLYKNA